MRRALFLSLAALLLAVGAQAHPPKALEVTYDRAAKQLAITVTHGVSDVKSHYIDVITIEVDGKEVQKLTLKEQSSLESHQARVDVGDLKPGTRILVKASCNKFGSKKATLTVE